jgi:sodium/potassium-transporting ATPase subunit alpha
MYTGIGQDLPTTDPLYREATAACLTASVVMQVANLFACRGDRAPAFRAGLAGNRLILVGVAAELAAILLIDYTGVGQLLFGTGPVPLWAWLAVVPFAAAMLALEEARKWLARRRG